MSEAADHKQIADSKAQKVLRVGHLDSNRVGCGHPSAHKDNTACELLLKFAHDRQACCALAAQD